MTKFHYGKKSMGELDTCDKELKLLCCEALIISPIDISIICGHRSKEEQFKLFKIGREKGDKRKVVTFADGYETQSKHNINPSQAIDFAPYIDGKARFDDEYIPQYEQIVKAFKDASLRLEIDIRCGADFENLKDYGHIELC